MSSFKSKRDGHALQRDEKIDLIFIFLKKLAKSRFPDVYQDVLDEWRNE
jgi:hypothetical protein